MTLAAESLSAISSARMPSGMVTTASSKSAFWSDSAISRHGHVFGQHEIAGFDLAFEPGDAQIEVEEIGVGDEALPGQARSDKAGRLPRIDAEGPLLWIGPNRHIEIGFAQTQAERQNLLLDIVGLTARTGWRWDR